MKQADEGSIRCLGIYSLRDMAREMGVKSPTTLKKEELIERILNIMSGKVAPDMPRTRQGRPPKNKSKIVLSTEDVDLYNELDGEFSGFKNNNQENEWFFCDNFDNEIGYNDKCNYREGKGYLENINDRQYLFSAEDCSNPKKAILVPKDIDNGHFLRAGDLVKCLYKDSETYEYKILNKIINEDEFANDRINYEDLQRVESQDCVSLFSKKVMVGSKFVVKVNNFANYKEKIIKLKQNNKDCHVVNLVLDSLIEDKYPNIETICSFVGDSTKRNCFVVRLVIDRIKRLVENGEKVILCVNELLKIAKYQNFMLGYDYGVVKANSFSSIFNLFRLVGVYSNGASVTLVALLKNDKTTKCGEYLLNELDNLNVSVQKEN